MRKLLTLQEGSFEKNGVGSYRELWAKAKAAGYTGMVALCAAEFTKSAEGAYHAVFSTDSEDRHREIVYQDFDVRAFKKNPVFLDSHNYYGIEYIIGKVSNLRAKKGEALEGDIVFATENPRGALAEKLVAGGFANATSIGFIPTSFDQDGNILTSELLEVSLVSVPANPEALIDTGKALGDPADVPPAGDPAPADPVPADPQEDPAPVLHPAKQIGAEHVVAALRSEAQRRSELAKYVASEVQALVAPGARKRELMQHLRALSITKQ